MSNQEPQKKPGWRHSLYARAMIFTLIGSGSLLGAIVVQSFVMVRGSVDRLLQERTDLARATGGFLEHLIRKDLLSIGNQTYQAHVDLTAKTSQAGTETLQQNLAIAYRGTLFQEGAFILNRRSERLVSVPDNLQEIWSHLNIKDLTSRALSTNAPVSVLLRDLSHGLAPVLCVLLPVQGGNKQVIGFVGGILNPATTPLLEPFLDSTGRTSTTLQLIDESGYILAATKGALFEPTDHGSLLAQSIKNQTTIHGRCHNCHESAQLKISKENEVLAFVPLPALKLGIAVRQSEKDALAPAFSLQRKLILTGGAFVILFLTFTGLAVHSVVRPVTRLTREVRNAEEANSKLNLSPYGKDEVGELALALERWRSRVLDSIAETKSLKQSREFLQKVLQAQEEERRRISREIHDTIAQDLAAHRLEIERMSKQPSLPPELAVRLGELEVSAGGILQTARQMLVDLRPSVLDQLGFHSALQWYLERLRKEGKLVGSLSIEGQECELDRDMTVTLFRVFQECLKNILIHAKASHVLVTLIYGEDQFTMSVEDDGTGFNREQIRSKYTYQDGRGLGLFGMEERVKLLNGSLTITSGDGEGTTVVATVPLLKEAEKT